MGTDATNPPSSTVAVPPSRPTATRPRGQRLRLTRFLNDQPRSARRPESTGWNRRQVVVDQFRLHAFQGRIRGPDGPANRKPNGRCVPPASSEAPYQAAGTQGRPGVERAECRDEVVPRQPRVLLHPGRYAIEEPVHRGRTERILPLRRCQSSRARSDHGQERAQAPAPVGVSSRRSALPTTRETTAEAAIKATPTGPLVRVARAINAPECSGQPTRRPLGQLQRAELGPDQPERERGVGGRELRLGDHDRGRRKHQAQRASPPKDPACARPIAPGRAGNAHACNRRDQPASKRVVAPEGDPSSRISQ